MSFSWQDYVDKSLVGSGKVTQAAIIGQQGGVWGVWAASAGFNLDPSEVKQITGAFKNENLADTRSKGIVLGGTKYFTLSADDLTIQLKKAADGAVLYKTKDTILVTEYRSPVQQAECFSTVVALGEYLRSFEARD